MATPSLTLGELIARAGSAIRERLPAQAWVEAVVLEAKPNRAGLSLELVEPFADTRNNAFLRCFVGTRARSEIEAEIGLPLDVATLKGIHARLLLKPSFHPRYHLEGQVVGLDPAIVRSLVARRVEMIRETLRAENILGAQGRLATPEDITFVAVIHPDKSAGWADVHAELQRLQDRSILALRSYPVAFEGARAVTGIVQALGEILSDAETPRPDLILVIRGGGAAAGLAALADLALARAVCRCPVPIVTGLGHASDRTLLNDIAWRAADTPSNGIVPEDDRLPFEVDVIDHQAAELMETAELVMTEDRHPEKRVVNDLIPGGEAIVGAGAARPGRPHAGRSFPARGRPRRHRDPLPWRKSPRWWVGRVGVVARLDARQRAALTRRASTDLVAFIEREMGQEPRRRTGPSTHLS